VQPGPELEEEEEESRRGARGGAGTRREGLSITFLLIPCAHTSRVSFPTL